MSITAKYQRLFFQPRQCRIVTLCFRNGYQVTIIDGRGQLISKLATHDAGLIVEMFERCCQNKQVFFYDAQQQISRLRALALLHGEAQVQATDAVIAKIECWQGVHCVMSDFSLLTGSHAMPIEHAMRYQGLEMETLCTLTDYCLASLNLIRTAVGFRPTAKAS